MSVLECLLIITVSLLTIYVWVLRYDLKTRAAASVFKEKADKLNYNNLAVSYLDLLCRELANELIQRDANYFRNNFVQLSQEWKAIQNNKELLTKTLEHLSLKYEMYQDFSPFDVRNYVFVGEGAETCSNEELWERFKDAKLYSTLLCGDGIGSLDILNDYLKSVEETKLLYFLYEAETEYMALRANGVRFTDGEIDTPRHTFTRLNPTLETRLGVFIKTEMKYGIIAKFYDSTSYASYYKSDKLFETEESLLDTKRINYLRQNTELRSIRKIY